MMNNLQSSAQVANKLLTVLQRYTKGIRFVAFLLVLFTVNIGTASAEKSIDFESGTATYSDWTFTNMTSQQSGSITAKGGSYYGTTGGKSTASIQTKNQISSPKSISCYVSKQSNNTTSSTWYIQTSANGSSWTNVKTQSATSMSKGSWVEFTADLSSYSNVYVRIYYSGSTAVRNIDNLVLTEGTTTSYDVNWMVNGENYTTGSPSTSVSEGSQVTILPTPPTLDCGGKMFVGWSNEEVTDGTEPDVLFATAENSPAITEPTTFHAVFATKGSNQTATFDAATISGLTKSSSSLTWTHNNSGIALYLSEGQRYTSGTPNTFTVTKGTSNYCQLSAPTGIVMSKVVATLSGANYKINSVSTPWTLSTSSTIQTISSTNGSDYLKMSATSDYQIRITQLVVTYATYSDYTTQCSTQTLICAYHNIR